MDGLSNAIVPIDLLLNVVNNIEYNNVIIEYYKKYSLEIEKHRVITIENKIENIHLCNKFWDIDKYKVHKVKDFKRTNLCKDKFCNNCKKVNQAARMSRYMPELELYKNISYHLTLTSPTVLGIELKDKIKQMAKCFRQLHRYLNGTDKIRGYDFLKWGYKGSIRSLEITFKDDFYHPHYHCLLVLDSLDLTPKSLINDYSYSYGKFKQFFSEEEILIQKIWYLLINNQRVTKKSIDNLEIGYSCKLDKLKDGDYNELFKYITKEMNEKGEVFTYENFKVLYEALYRVKQIQGYGCLYRITDDGDTESMIEEYQKIIDKLKEEEIPDRVLETPQELLKDKEYLLISRKSYMKYLREIEGK